MSRGKLQRFAELDSFSNSFYEPLHLKGKWNSDYFRNEQPITLELGCGRGEYTIGLARLYPERNFIGIDLKGARLWRGAKTGMEESIPNVAFIRSHIERISEYFAASEVSEIWITFPDPQPQLSREKKRLVHPRFLEMYRSFLKPGAAINLKTDNDSLYEYCLDVISSNNFTLISHSSDVYASDEISPELQIQTTYEGKYLLQNKKIKYVRFTL